VAILQFDATTVQPNAPLEPVPSGDYLCMIVDSEMKPTSRGDGAYLQLTMEILEGPYQGRKLFDRLNLQNPNAQAVEIAYRTLSAICHAVGRLQVNDSAELHDKPLIAKVALKPPKGEYGESNEVKGYKAVNGAVGMTGVATRSPTYPQPGVAPAAPAAASRPWAR